MMASWLRLAAGLNILVLAGCSFILNWNYDGLACDTNQHLACAGGYSCLPEGSQFQCIKDHSRKLDQSCLLDRQCQQGQLCPHGVCAPQCGVTSAYADPSPCAEGRYCAPFLSTAGITDPNDANVLLVAVCVPGDTCSPGAACSEVSGGVCTPINASVNACLTACHQTFTSGTYSDDCTSGLYYPTYCTPVGEARSQQLVCLSTGPIPASAGSACISPVAQPCQPHTGCVNGVCRTYCEGPNASCPTGQKCCSYNLDPNNSFNYCVEPAQCG